MKVGLWISILALSSSIAFASGGRNTNPLARTCRLSDGEFESLLLGTPQEFAVCWYRETVIDAQSTLMAYSYKSLSMALAAFKLGSGISSCDKAGAHSVLHRTQYGVIQFCEFTDGSLMDLETLSTGFSESTNFSLRSLVDF